MEFWTPQECADFVARIGLPQYRETFEKNMTGSRLLQLQIHQLPSMNIGNFAHQQVGSTSRMVRSAVDPGLGCIPHAANYASTSRSQGRTKQGVREFRPV